MLECLDALACKIQFHTPNFFKQCTNTSNICLKTDAVHEGIQFWNTNSFNFEVTIELTHLNNWKPLCNIWFRNLYDKIRNIVLAYWCLVNRLWDLLLMVTLSPLAIGPTRAWNLLLWLVLAVGMFCHLIWGPPLGLFGKTLENTFV